MCILLQLSRRILFFHSLPGLAPHLLCFLSLNCVGVWQKPWQVERQTELTDCWHLHSRRACIKCSWQGPLFHFSGEIWWIMKQARLRVSSCTCTGRGGHVSPCPLLVVTYSLCVNDGRSSTVKPEHQGRSVWGESPLNGYPGTIIFYSHTHRTMFVHINKTIKGMRFRCMPVGCLLWFLSWVFAVFLFVNLRIPLQWCPYGGILNFQVLYIKWIPLPSSSPNTLPYLLSTDFAKLWSSETNMHTFLNAERGRLCGLLC